MKLVSRLVTAVIILVVIGAATALIWSKAGRKEVGQGFHTYAMFRDASGLPVGSQVVIAGLQVGEIDGLSIQGGVARVSMKLRDDVVLWSDAWAEKKAASLLGDSLIELSPGGPTGPDDRTPYRRLARGEPIPRVIEGASTDRLLRSIDRAMPRVDQFLDGSALFFGDGRRWAAGNLTRRASDVDAWLAAGHIEGSLDSLGTGVAFLDDWSLRAEAVTADVAPQVNARLDKFAVDVADATVKMREARGELESGLREARAGLADVDPFVARVNAALASYDGQGPADQQGGFTELLNDPTLHDRVARATEEGTGLFSTLGRLQIWVGLRTEYNILAANQRFFVTAEIAARNDAFYLVELEKGPLGGVPETTLESQPGSDVWTRRSIIRERLRFTAQWGKRLGPMALRIGIKESAFGIGADAVLLGGSLRLAADAYGSDYGPLPRVKLAAAFEVFRTFYVLGGIEDALNEGGTLPIGEWPAEQDVPIQFREVRYGRDYFLGFVLRFNDDDLKAMMFAYGAALAAGL